MSYPESQIRHNLPFLPLPSCQQEGRGNFMVYSVKNYLWRLNGGDICLDFSSCIKLMHNAWKAEDKPVITEGVWNFCHPFDSIGNFILFEKGKYKHITKMVSFIKQPDRLKILSEQGGSFGILFSRILKTRSKGAPFLVSSWSSGWVFVFWKIKEVIF